MHRLLVLCEYPTLNGGEYSLLALLPALQADGFQVEFGTPGTGPLADRIRHLGCPLHQLSLRDGGEHRVALEEARSRLSELLTRVRPDLVHANSLSMARLLGPVARQQQIPSLGHLRDILRLNRAATDDLNQLDRLLAVSEATRRWHLAQGLDSGKTHVLYNGVDLRRLHPRPSRGWLHQELGIAPGSLLVGGIGQLILRKGVDTWLQAAALVAEQHDGVHFVLVGERYSRKAEARIFEQQLRKQAAAPPLDGRCFFLGVREDVPELLNELTVLLHTARQEPLGRVLLEAAAAGVPLVATDVGGTTEILPRETGGLVPPNDPAAAAGALVELLEDRPLRVQRAAAVRRLAEQNFDCREAGRKLAKHYREVLVARPGTPS